MPYWLLVALACVGVFAILRWLFGPGLLSAIGDILALPFAMSARIVGWGLGYNAPVDVEGRVSVGVAARRLVTMAVLFALFMIPGLMFLD